MGSHLRGESNSSLTRVRPIFKALINRDETGLSWFSKILGLSTENLNLVVRLSEDSSKLSRETTEKRKYQDRVLREYGVPDIELEACFEKPFPPPRRFLRWLIENPERMIWRESSFGKETLEKRGRLFGKFGPALAQGPKRCPPTTNPIWPSGISAKVVGLRGVHGGRLLSGDGANGVVLGGKTEGNAQPFNKVV